jgi:septal ring factor EnvC (AmiA/AmiB activator)
VAQKPEKQVVLQLFQSKLVYMWYSKTIKMKKAIILFTFLCCGFMVKAQDRTIEEQFNNLLAKSNRWQDFKVIDIKSFEKLKENSKDSLNALKAEIAATADLITAQAAEIEDLKQNIASISAQLEQVNAEKESISVLGLLIEKESFKRTTWTITGALLMFLLFFIVKFKRSHSIIAGVNNTLLEMQEEFNSFRKRSMEKEQKLARDLQNEINKRLI